MCSQEISCYGKGLPVTLNSWLQMFRLMLKPSAVNDNKVRCHTQVKVT